MSLFFVIAYGEDCCLKLEWLSTPSLALVEKRDETAGFPDIKVFAFAVFLVYNLFILLYPDKFDN